MNELEELKARLARVEELIFRNDAKYGKKSSENNSAVSEVKNKTDTLDVAVDETNASVEVLSQVTTDLIDCIMEMSMIMYE